jgi:DNA-binding Lrp family transcriptional regulator
MDRTDVSLCLMLMANSRTPYHELAAKLGLSINAVHKRIGAMTKVGLIRAFTAHPSLAYLGAVTTWIYGRSDAARPVDAHLRLKNDDRTYWVANSGGGYIYVGGYLRDVSELDDYVAFVKREGELSDPTVGIMPAAGMHPPKEGLRPLDYQILASLSRNSRKPASDVAAEVNASAKTVHRRLEWMMEKGLVDFGIDFYPDVSNDIIALFHVESGKGFDRQEVRKTMNVRFSHNILVDALFSNLPNLLVLFMWTNSMKQMEELREEVTKMEEVKSVEVNVLQIGYMFETWRDHMVAKYAEPSSTRRV